MLTLLIWSTTLTHAQVRQQPDLPQGISESWWQQVQKHIRQSEYHIAKRDDGQYTSPNRAQNLRFVYEPNGFSATRRDSLAHLWHARLTFAGLSKSGTNPDSQNAHAFTLTAEANTLVAQSDAVVIKYCNDEKGMRQDFIVKRKPDGNGDLRLWLYAEMQGGTVSTTANWTGESNQVIAYLGYTVASAGDVNGDGFSDVIVGALRFDNGETDEGRAYVYYGNGGSGLRQEVRQFRPSTTTPIVPALKTNSLNSVTLQKRRQSIAGRSTMQLEFEVKPLGTAFNGLGLQNTGFSLHATGGTPTSALIGGLSDRTLYKWRVRQVEKSTGIGYILLPRSRWYYPAGVAPTESHFQVSSDALPLPVELSSFSAQRVERGVELVWTTASEKNNAGFEVQRRSEKQASEEWQVLGFVKGNGTTSDAKSYSFVDRTASGKVQYRLKQVDFDGTFEYSPVIEVEAGMPRTFELGQNYPNPFNPTTLISYQLPVASEVSLKVYDVLGREVMTLVNGKQDAGSYNLNFNASNLSSGVYFYRLQAGSFVQTKKMMLVK
jgi:hypothetical protein